MRGLPKALWACAAIAFVHAALWAVVTPPFQTPDELGHAGYAQYLAETGKLPSPAQPGTSQEIAVTGMLLPQGIETRPTWSRVQADRLLDELGSGKLGRSHPGEAQSIVNYPPLYYTLEVIPYRAGYDLGFLDRLLLMRLMSALFAAITVGFAFCFLRELLPGTPWAWTIGALAVAFQPLFGFMSGGVNNDDLLYTCAAGLFFLVARAFRRGLSPGLAVAIGLVSAAGVLTKQSMLGLLPGAALGLAWVAWHAVPERRRAALISLGAAGAIVIVPALAWVYASRHLVHRPATSIVGGLTNSDVNSVSSLSGQVSYVWQVFLPPLPTMNDQIPYWIPWRIWFRGFVGIFGWFEFSFQEWVYTLGAVILGGVVLLAGVELGRRHDALRRRWAELATYVLMVAGLLAVIEFAAYRYYATTHQFFEQTRYLFPLLALYGAIVALAVRGAGKKWGPATGAFLVVLFMGHSLFSMFQVIARYYA